MTIAGTLPKATSDKRFRLTTGFALPDRVMHSTADTSVTPFALTSRHPDQMYFWSEEWQSAEQASRADILAGRVTVLEGKEEIRRHFLKIAERSRKRRVRRDSGT